MPNRKKILIVENDDFLREILGNILHQKGNYIISGFCVEDTLKKSKNKNISLVILGTSCERYGGKKTISYIKKSLGYDIKFYILNNSENDIDFIPKDMQMKISELSVSAIVDKIQNTLI